MVSRLVRKLRLLSHLFLVWSLSANSNSLNCVVYAKPSSSPLTQMNKSSSSIHDIIKKLNGGSSNNHNYELNVVTLGDLEKNNFNYNPPQQQHQFQSQQYSSYPRPPQQRGQQQTLPITQMIQAFFHNLHNLSPTLSTVTIATIVIFLMWQCTPNLIPIAFLQNNFVCSPYTILTKKRYHTAFLATLSHTSLTHLALNLYMYYSFGKRVIQCISPYPLWPIFLGSSLFGSMAYLALTNPNTGGGYIGLSGVTSSFLSLYAQMYPHTVFHLRLPWPLWAMFPDVTIPLSARQMLQLFTGITLFGLCTGKQQHASVAHATHLGGLIFGVFYVELWKRRSVQKMSHWGSHTRVWKTFVKTRSNLSQQIKQRSFTKTNQITVR